jgi:hypothetical protein
MPGKKRRFRFSIASLLVTMAVVSLALAFWRVNPTVFWVSLIATFAANVLGAGVAWCITNVFRLPNDGALRQGSDDMMEP